jgi:pantoate--beta-alanine ligase
MIPILARTKAGLAAARATLPPPVVLVPTMGALHDGHRALLRRARELASPSGSVAVSVFVNPLQFGAGEDLDRYPRTLERDLAVCGEEGAAVVFAPDRVQMYPAGQMITVYPGVIGQRLEGASRPGFFDGVLTAVLKLFHLVAPDVAVFGEKDAQQLALVRRMTAELNLGVRIAAVPTVRDSDGLATSSRNAYLSPAERSTALAIPRALFAARQAARRAADDRAADEDDRAANDRAADDRAADDRAADEDDRAPGAGGLTAAAAPAGRDLAGQPDRSAAAALAAARAVLYAAAGAEPPLVTDYLALADPDTFDEVHAGRAGQALLLVAARVGSTRLIDNTALALDGHASASGARQAAGGAA